MDAGMILNLFRANRISTVESACHLFVIPADYRTNLIHEYCEYSYFRDTLEQRDVCPAAALPSRNTLLT